MAALAPAAGVLKLKFLQSQGGRSWSNALHVVNIARLAWTGADISTILGAATSAWEDNVGGLQDSSIVFNGTEATDLTSAMSLVMSDPDDAPGTITDAQKLPPSVCLRSTFLDALRRRGGHGGVFLSVGAAVSLLEATPSEWDPVTTAAATAAWEAIFLALRGATLTGSLHADVCNVSYINAGVPRVVPLVLSVTGVETQQRVCHQRKRDGKGIAGG